MTGPSAMRQVHVALGHIRVPDLTQVLTGPSCTQCVQASEIKLSHTPVCYCHPPPLVGQHPSEVLTELASLSDDDLHDLQAGKVI